MTCAEEYYEDEFYPENFDDYDLDDDFDDDPGFCGPWCGDCWGGDGICMAEIAAMVEEGEAYEAAHTAHDVPCPVCGKRLTQYDVMANELWIWPGDWYSPMIALNVYAVYDCPKGEIHRLGDTCHIWIGEGDYRREQLIRLIGSSEAVPV